MGEPVRFPEDFNLADYWLFDRLKEGKGSKVALRFGDRSWTYADVADRSRALARFLVENGVRPEQRVYIVLPDTPAFAWGIFGTLASGCVLAMGNPIAPIEDLGYVLQYLRAAVLITTPAVAGIFLLMLGNLVLAHARQWARPLRMSVGIFAVTLVIMHSIAPVLFSTVEGVARRLGM